MAKVAPSISQPCEVVCISSPSITPERIPETFTCSLNNSNSRPPKKQSIYQKVRYLFTIRMLIAILMSSCLMALSVTTTNLTGSLVCMVIKEDENTDKVRTKRSQDYLEEALNETDIHLLPCSPNSASSKDPKLSFGDRPDPTRLSKRSVDGGANYVEVRSCYADERLNWTMFEQGMVLCAQNVGSLLMVLTGPQADRLNGKWTMAVALVITVISNLMLPILAAKHIIFAICARILCGVADALLTPSVSSMIARWFPPKERPFAIGFITGGRQIGSLLILPVSGWACLKKDTFGGWKLTFYISAVIGALTLIVWLILSADKPSKHCCVKKEETSYILRKISEESLGKRKERKSTPWKSLLTSRPFIAGIFAVVCQEYPLVITTTLMPIYMKEVLHLSDVRSTLYSALPLLALWISKNLSSSLSSFLSARKTGHCLLGRTALVKLFNGVASAGLALGLMLIPFLRHSIPAVIAVCAANAFAGLHTPGVFTSLLQIAPAYTGSVTGIAFSAGHVANIVNKLTNGLILHSWSSSGGQWKLLYSISAVTAFLPVVFFSIWGSADLQPWAIPELKEPSSSNREENTRNGDSNNQSTSPTYLAETLPTPV